MSFNAINVKLFLSVLWMFLGTRHDNVHNAKVKTFEGLLAGFRHVLVKTFMKKNIKKGVSILIRSKKWHR